MYFNSIAKTLYENQKSSVGKKEVNKGSIEVEDEQQNIEKEKNIIRSN